MMFRRLGWILFIFCSLSARADERALDLIDRIDNLYRLDSSYAVMSMEIVTPDWQRTLTMEAWSKGMDYTLVRVISPAKEKGISTLKRDSEMWNYFPKINKVIKVPPSMMMGSWMGSDFTNDDLVREVSLAEDYDVSLEDTDTLHILTLVPKEMTVTVWGRIVIEVDQQNLLPVREIYYDEDGTAMREMIFKDVRDYDGRLIPAVMELVPLNKDNQKTILRYETLTFNEPVDDDIFTLRNLKKIR